MDHDRSLVADPAVIPESFVVTVDTGDRLHYLDWGGPRESERPRRLPPLVLIHGLGLTAGSGRRSPAGSCCRTRVVALDLRGHGLSESPRTGYDLESLAYDALTVLTANGLGARRRRAAGRSRRPRPRRDRGGNDGEAPAAVRGGTGARRRRLGGPGRGDRHDGRRVPARPRRSAGGDGVDGRLPGRPARLRPGTWDADQERAARAAVDEKHRATSTSVVRRPRAAGSVRGDVRVPAGRRPGDGTAVRC